MFKNRLFIYLATVAIALFAIVSCSEDTGTNPSTGDKPSPASNLQATSVNETTVRLMFTISPSETNSLFKDYELSWKEEGPSAGSSKSVGKSPEFVDVTALTEGKVYLFTLITRYTNDSVSTPVTVKWSPATRFDGATYAPTESIKVYETSSLDFGSGIQLFSSIDEGPMTYKVANGGKWDLGIRTVDGKISFGSATKLGYIFGSGQNPGSTQIMSEYFWTDSLNGKFDNRAMDDADRNGNYSEQVFDLAADLFNSNPNLTKNVVFYVRKIQSGETKYNYAKVLVKRGPGGGTFLQGDSPNRYIEVQISYQMTPDVPYAKTANNNDTN